jgi:hypothetical protein
LVVAASAYQHHSVLAVDTEGTRLWSAVDRGNLAKRPEARCDISSLSSMFDIDGDDSDSGAPEADFSVFYRNWC